MSVETRPAYGSRRGRNAAPTKPRKREWWHYLLASLGLLALIGLVWAAYASWFSIIHVRTTYARVSGLVISLSAKDDSRVQEILVSTGDTVKNGQVVAYLDKAGPEADVQQAQAKLDAANSALARAEADLEMTIRQTTAGAQQAEAELAAAQARLAQAEAEMKMQAQQQPDEVRKAEADLARLKAGPRPQEIKQARAEVKAAESQLARADASLRRMEKLYQEGAISAQAIDTARTDKDVAEATLDAARENLSILEGGSRPEDIAAAEAALALAKAKTYEGQMMGHQVATRKAESHQAEAVLSSVLSTKREVALKEQDVLSQRAAVAEAQAALDSAKARLADVVLRSTTDGVVVRGPGKSVHDGEVVTAGQPIVTIVDTKGSLWISASVSELYVSRVKEGQPVLITLDAFPGRKLIGHVAQVAKATDMSSTTSTTASPWQVQQVPIRISFDPKALRLPGQGIIPGMTCQAWIDVR